MITCTYKHQHINTQCMYSKFNQIAIPIINCYSYYYDIVIIPNAINEIER